MEQDPPTRGEMSFGDHLEELRSRVIMAVSLPLPISILLFFFADGIRALLIKPALVALEANGLPAHLQALEEELRELKGRRRQIKVEKKNEKTRRARFF